MLLSAMTGGVGRRCASGVSPFVRFAGPAGFIIPVCTDGGNGVFRLFARAPGGESNATSLTCCPICRHKDRHDLVVH
ncbi:MAG TPA: hypothetical protein VER96_02000 [Polyangiaceae bacterium]|nr:hypothetical protein [Polyangiaceae bacterium]